MTALVAPKTCRRCSGEGFVASMVVYAGVPGTCYACAGQGLVEGDKATIAAKKARIEAQTGIITFVVDALVAAGVPRYQAITASYALDHLSTSAPDRYEAALVSYQKGHPGLVKAVWAYAAEQGFVLKGTRALSVPEVLALLG